MKKQVFELNSGSIDNIGIYRDRIEFFQANRAELVVELKITKK